MSECKFVTSWCAETDLPFWLLFYFISLGPGMLGGKGRGSMDFNAREESSVRVVNGKQIGSQEGV
jgi:hypothetical protein